MRKLYMYEVVFENIESRYEWWKFFACVSDDPSTALKVILDSDVVKDLLRSGRPDERKRLKHFKGPNQEVLVEASA